jgi:hypothetical protein
MARLNALLRSHPRDPGVLVAVGQIEAHIGNPVAALSRYEIAVKLDSKYMQGWEGIAGLWQKGVVSRAEAAKAVLILIGLAPLTWQDYFSYPALDAFGDKSGLWLAYQKANKMIVPLPKWPLLPLEASKRSLAAGTRAYESQSSHSSLYKSAGAELGDLREVRSLFP